MFKLPDSLAKWEPACICLSSYIFVYCAQIAFIWLSLHAFQGIRYKLSGLGVANLWLQETSYYEMFVSSPFLVKSRKLQKSENSFTQHWGTKLSDCCFYSILAFTTGKGKIGNSLKEKSQNLHVKKTGRHLFRLTSAYMLMYPSLVFLRTLSLWTTVSRVLCLPCTVPSVPLLSPSSGSCSAWWRGNIVETDSAASSTSCFLPRGSYRSYRKKPVWVLDSNGIWG